MTVVPFDAGYGSCWPWQRSLLSQYHSCGRRWSSAVCRSVDLSQSARFGCLLRTDMDPGRLPSDHLVTLWQFGTSDNQCRRGLSQQLQQPFRHVAPVSAAVSRLAAEVPVWGTVYWSAAGSRPHTDSTICSVRQTRRWPVVSEAVVQPWVRCYFANHAADLPVCMWHFLSVYNGVFSSSELLAGLLTAHDDFWL